MSQYPQVLMLGNGLNRAYEGASWSDLLDKIKCRNDFNVNDLKAPMPLKAILVTKDNIKEAIKKHSKEFFGEIKNAEQSKALCKLLNLGFDDILTTNYSYEIEAAAMGSKTVSESRLRRISDKTCKKMELRYLLHTYNKVRVNEKETRVWHIHGEAKKPDSMMFGHYWYGNMLGRIKAELNQKGNRYASRQKQGVTIDYDSWIDSFILGDVYIVGFGFDFNEFDLWWLLNRRFREKARKGKVYFYEPKSEENREKQELMDLLGVKTENLGFKNPSKDDYKQFYNAVIQDITDKMSR